MNRQERKREEMAGQVIVVTGWRGTGKTTFCRYIATRASQAGWKVAGILTPARFEDGVKTGIEVEDLTSGNWRNLAVRAAEIPTEISLGAWNFDPEALTWGNEILQKATPCDLLIIDELGPLEFERKQGWISGLEALDKGDFKLALVIIRPEYEGAFRARWPNSDVVTIATPGDVLNQVEEFSKKYLNPAG
jgi:nucleoside-triphosphatase THEP1